MPSWKKLLRQPIQQAKDGCPSYRNKFSPKKRKMKKNTNYLINLIEEKIQIAHQRTWENWVSPELGTRGPSQWNV